MGVICTLDYIADWENLTKEEYRVKKEEVAQMFIARLDKLIPGIKGEVEYYEVGTPKTIKRFLLILKGQRMVLLKYRSRQGEKGYNRNRL